MNSILVSETTAGIVRRAADPIRIGLGGTLDDALLISLTAMIEDRINTIIRSAQENGVSLKEVRLRWTNIPDVEKNPAMDIGNIMIVATAHKPE